MPDLVPVKRALLSVSDKTGLADFAKALHQEFGVELISTGGTATFLRAQNLSVTDVSEVTGFPEMMDGRIKTLHPKIHGGLLALRDNPDHAAAMAAHDIKPIDLLCINLYPFAKTIEKPNVTLEEAIENIDIGGPAMIRSASKNHQYVLVVTSPNRYEKVLGDLRKHHGSSCAQHRLKQAQSAFAHTAEYDGLIAKYLAKKITPEVQPEPSPQADLVPAERLSIVHPAFDALFLDLVMTVGLNTGASHAFGFLIVGTGKDRALHLRATVRCAGPDLSGKLENGSLPARVLNEMMAILDYRPNESASGQVYLSDKNEPQRVVFVGIPRIGTRSAVAVVAVIFDGSTRASMDVAPIGRIVGIFRDHTPFAVWATELADSAPAAGLPNRISLLLRKVQNLRYGENPHQTAALYIDAPTPEASVAYAKQLHGKELSYINLLDADGALLAVKEFSDPAACIVKHTTPCGCAAAADLPTAFRRAFDGDPLAAFGGIVALNKPVDLATAQAITGIDKLLEVIVAPSYADDALALLKDRWKNVRLLEVGPLQIGSAAKFDSTELMLHKIVGGYLVQQRDLTGLNETDWKIASKRQPTEKELADLRFAWLVCKHVKSNAIVVAKDRMLLGAGAGQMDRPSAARLAITKAGERVKNAVAASDAFFPFPDGPKLLLDAGVTAIIHPGGSLKDQDTIDLINERGAALVLTGQRHFKH